jgi:hypothetical protein
MGAMWLTPGAAPQAAPAAAPAPSSELAAKAPAVVMILRHAEKPLGDEKLPDLTAEGYRRAELLPSLFLPLAGSGHAPRFPRPAVIFATDTSKHSNRPMETIAPLAHALQLPIDHDFADRQVKELSELVLSGKYAGKVVLICWHHGEIPHLAQALGVENAPAKWDDTVFDRVWMIQWVDGKPQFDILPEALMPGDAKR